MKEKITTVLVDDENKSLLTLRKLIEQYCPELIVLGTAGNVRTAVEAIDSLHPGLVFLDISLPDGNGFDILEQVEYKNFHVIFVTASDRYAVKAFEFSAIHYLLKPVNHSELQEAVSRFFHRQEDILNENRLHILRESLSNRHEKIILPCAEGFCVVELNQITRIEADDNYSWFYLQNGDKILVSKSLGNFEQLLKDLPFIRVHSKHLINIRYLVKYVKGKGGYVIMQDGSHLDVSESRKREFLDKIRDFARGLG
ncbi:MAG TPA: LytTR family DNA-binding domain-containing protein [Bacteroidales bacterium]|nr:LytTR family DNA-binding domain-containing protein [Bacteroidales bacterium]HSA44022.1 LytTR family DNA-binding domain-containing protein [Bacteroidales bacterium]